MPIDYKKYPSNWLTEIRPRILARDKNRCVKCGLNNYSVGQRNKEGRFIPSAGNVIWDLAGQGLSLSLKPLTYKEARDLAIYSNDNLEWDWDNESKYIVIVLTVAHYDQDINNNEDSNLGSLCQYCHLTHDRKYRKQNKDNKYGQLILF